MLTASDEFQTRTSAVVCGCWYAVKIILVERKIKPNRLDASILLVQLGSRGLNWYNLTIRPG
jgi:hypothetical protein